MKFKLEKYKSLSRKQLIVIGAVFLLIISICITLCICLNQRKAGVLEYMDSFQITVTPEEMQQYRERIGTDLDIKKAVFILFETEEECRRFIETHGADEKPEQAGVGIVPLMEDGYYNIVGKSALEDVFDTLSDGEYAKEPIAYSNLFCYLKRIGIDSPAKDDTSLKKFIENEKMQEMRKEGE